tara:strand:- start:81 stop:422 length:342 start_codon:yes stop_codon:yes gene_type:complete
MGISRYTSAWTAINSSPLYKDYFAKRGVTSIEQYRTVTLKHPTAFEMADLTFATHVWTLGDRFYKLAHEYYDDSEYWWIIALYNHAPTEFDLKLGDIVQIPMPLEDAIGILNI